MMSITCSKFSKNFSSIIYFKKIITTRIYYDASQHPHVTASKYIIIKIVFSNARQNTFACFSHYNFAHTFYIYTEFCTCNKRTEFSVQSNRFRNYLS